MKERVNGTSLEIFRIVLGLTVFAEAIRYLIELKENHVEPDFLFKFPLFSFVGRMPEQIMQGLLILLCISSIGIVLKKFYKASLLMSLIIYTYFFLLELSLFNNHYYLIILLLGLMLLIPQEGGLSKLKSGIVPSVPRWGICLVQFQLFIVYFFGGLAKVNSDWLRGDVMRAVFTADPSYLPSFLPLSIDQASTFYTFGGLFFDLLVVPLLLYKRTRIPAALAAIFFHGSNAVSLDIGVFPYFMIGALILFWTGDECLGILKKIKVLPSKLQFSYPEKSSMEMRPGLQAFLAVYLVIQLLLPVRHYFLPGNVDWNGQGKILAWRMKMPHKAAAKIQIHTFDKATGKQLFPKVKLNDHQVNALIYLPNIMPQFIDQLAGAIKNKRKEQLRFETTVMVSMNGRSPQKVYNQDFELGEVSYSLFGRNSWINPLQAR